MAVNVVVEVTPDAAPLPRLVHTPVGPGEQSFLGIAAPIFARAAVEPDVGRASARPARRDQAFHVMRDKADAVPIEQCEDLLVVPALVAELDDLLEVARKP